jgi:integration host factor subunit beta
MTYTRSELIDIISNKKPQLEHKYVEEVVKVIVDQISQTLATGNRIEIRGFGSFSLNYRPPRIARNPKTGTPVAVQGKYVPHFKPGKEIRERVLLSKSKIVPAENDD